MTGSLPFDARCIRPDVDADYVSEDAEIRDIRYFTNEANKNHLEDKGLALTILRCLPGDASTKSQYQNQKNSKYINSKPYHRWFLCADLANPPHCFSLLTENLSQTSRLLIHNLDDSFMGRSFYLMEPSITKDKQGNYLNLLHCGDSELLPLNWDANLSSKNVGKIELPPSSDELFYFTLENVPINLRRARAPTDPSCTGFQCDRQKKRGECLCLNLIPGSPLVYSFDVEFSVDPKLFKENTHVTAGFRSYRTTTVFFNNFADYSSTSTFDKEHALQKRRRQQMKKIVDYVNTHGGWKLVGWCRKGKITVEGESEKIDNTTVNLRLSYVYPSNLGIFQDKEFMKLQIKGDDHDEVSGRSENGGAFKREAESENSPQGSPSNKKGKKKKADKAE